MADAVRTAGIPDAPDGIFLTSSRTPGLGFDTTEQNVAWLSGKVTLAPGVEPRPAGESRIDFEDGSSVAVDVLDARPALTAAIGATHDNCKNFPAAPCALTITAASLGTAEVETSRGTATVPAWTFTGKGVSRPIVAVAVPEDVLKTPVEPVPPPGLAKPDPTLLQSESLTAVDGATLAAVLYHGACDVALQAHVVEYDDLVVVGGTHAPTTGGCVEVLLSTPATITLTKPLGDRAVISATSGVRLLPR